MIGVIERIYDVLGPAGPGPRYWRNEATGRLAAAIIAYLDQAIDPSLPGPTPNQFALVKDYCEYWVNAPCWRGEEIEQLRESIKAVCTVAELRRWIHEALDYGIDPL